MRCAAAIPQRSFGLWRISHQPAFRWNPACGYPRCSMGCLGREEPLHKKRSPPGTFSSYQRPLQNGMSCAPQEPLGNRSRNCGTMPNSVRKNIETWKIYTEKSMLRLMEAFYSTGGVAKALGVSPDRVRQLCESGVVTAEVTAGGQWRIPKAEIDRLKRDGLPPVPRPLPGPNGSARTAPARTAYGHPALLAPASDLVIDSAEDLVSTENLLKRRRLELELSGVEDELNARQRVQDEQRAEEERQEQMRRSAEDARRQRQESCEGWERYALNSVPHDAPPDVRLEVHQAVRDRLEKLDPLPPRDVSQRVIDALVDRAVGRWRRTQQIDRIIEDAVNQLPSGARSYLKPTKWQLSALADARQAVVEAGHGAPLSEIEFAVERAIERVAAEFKHEEQIAEFVRRHWSWLSGESYEERQQARQLVEEALAQLPVGASQQQMEQARDAALAPLRDRIASREEHARRERLRQDVITRAQLPWDLAASSRAEALAAVQKAIDESPEGATRQQLEHARDSALQPFLAAHTQRKEEARKLADAESRLSRLLSVSNIYDNLRFLERDDGIVAFDEHRDCWNTAEKVHDRIRPILLDAVLRDPKLTDAIVEKRTAELVKKHVNEFLEPDL